MGPRANAGAVGFEVEAAQEFAGDGAVGGGRLGGEPFGDQGGDFRGPFGVVIAARTAGRPSVGVPLGTGEEVAGAQWVEATQADAQFEGDGFRGQQAGAGLGKEMADQRWRNAVGELEFFIARKIAGKWIYRFDADTGRLSAFSRRSGCVPAEPYPPLKLSQFRGQPDASASRSCSLLKEFQL